jgi:hypothetical protein
MKRRKTSGWAHTLNHALPKPGVGSRRQEDDEDEDMRLKEQKAPREARRMAKFPKPPPGKGFDVVIPSSATNYTIPSGAGRKGQKSKRR